MTTPLQDRTALVTGASSGLGVDFAHELARRGCHVILVARREERLQEVKAEVEREHGVDAHVIPMDLVPDDAPERLYDDIQERGLAVDVLVNNAGFGALGEFAEVSWEREEDMLKLDILTVAHLTKLFLKDMKERDFGYILQVASMAAYQPTPNYASYAGAKSYVLSMGEALNYELRDTNVSCTVLSPGVTKTEFFEAAGRELSLYQRMVAMTSEEVAQIGVRGMLKRKPSVVPGLLNNLTVFSTRFLPRRLSTALGDTLINQD